MQPQMGPLFLDSYFQVQSSKSGLSREEKKKGGSTDHVGEGYPESLPKEGKQRHTQHKEVTIRRSVLRGPCGIRHWCPQTTVLWKKRCLECWLSSMPGLPFSEEVFRQRGHRDGEGWWVSELPSEVWGH